MTVVEKLAYNSWQERMNVTALEWVIRRDMFWFGINQIL